MRKIQSMSRPDIDAAIEALPSKFSVRKLLAKLPETVRDDETVLGLASGTYSDKPALMVLTDQRIIFIGRWAFQTQSEDFPISRISSVEVKNGVALAEIKICASNQEAKISGLARAEAKAIAEKARELISAPSVPPSQTGGDAADQLLKLKQLHDAGILDSAEYESKRQALVARL